jgi:hypothetical protein
MLPYAHSYTTYNDTPPKLWRPKGPVSYLLTKSFKSWSELLITSSMKLL